MGQFYKSALQVFSTTFAKVMAWFLALFVFIMLLGTMGGTPDKKEQVLEVLPGHNWKKGMITNEKIWEITLSGAMDPSTIQMQQLRKQASHFATRPNKGGLKAVLLVIDSPGGVSHTGFEMHHFIDHVRKTLDVPVYAYVDGICASAAYLTAVASSEIYVSESSVVGSVGVMARAFNISKLLEKIGVETKLFSQGDGKVQHDFFQPWDAEKDKGDSDFEKLIAHNYQLFCSKVAQYRPQLTAQRLEDELGAHVFSAIDAQKLGYIDHIVDSKEQCLQAIVKKMELGDYALVRFKSRGPLIDSLIEMSGPAVSVCQSLMENSH